jgi:hypothetical protein
MVILAVALPLAVSCVVSSKPLVITAPPAVEAVRPTDQGAPRPEIHFYDDFWRALADINLQSAWIAAGSSEQRKLADGIQDFMNGDNAEADSTIVQLLSADDSEVREVARITYGAILSAQGDWLRLATYADTVNTNIQEYSGIRIHDPASVEAWAPTLKGMSTTLTFADTVSSVPLSRSSGGIPTIPVSVNGVTKYFWIDTGSSLTVLSSAVADASGVTTVLGDSLELVTAVGRLPAHAAVIPSLRLGGVTVANARAMIVTGSVLQLKGPVDEVPPEAIDGVIGFDLIRQLDLTIDDNLGRVIIRKPSLRPPTVKRPRNLSWYGVPIVTLLSEKGVAVHLALDTGADETFGTPGMARKSGASWQRAERRIVKGFGGSVSEPGVVIPSVRLFLGDVPLVFRRIFLYEAHYPTIFTLDGTLGADAGRGGVVRIDMTNGRLDISRK